MKKINIIQFLPYYSPHKGGLETHSEQWGKWWVKKGYGDVINIVTEFDQDFSLGEDFFYEGIKIGYIKNGVISLIAPSIEIIPTFPLYKIWSKEYKTIIRYINTLNIDYVITRTRFFLTTLTGGIYSRKNKITWCHIEHGSDYVKLSSDFKNFIAKIYDFTIGKWVFKKSDILVGVSHACEEFIKNKFINRDTNVIYRGLDLPKVIEQNTLSKQFPGKTIIGFVGRLYKWKNVESLITAYYLLDEDIKRKIQVVVVGDGEDFERLNKLDTENKIHFTGGKTFNEVLDLQKQFDIHFHTSSPGGGLATTLLQAIYLGCFIVSTPYEGAKEVIIDGENGILLKDDSIEELKKGLEKSLDSIGKKEVYGNKNKELFDSSFIWEKNIEKYYNLFK